MNALVPVLLLAAAPQATHPLHTTLTTIAWDSRTQALRVAVRVFTQDLSDALARGTVAAPDSAACRYARSALTVRDRTGQSLAVGRCTIDRTGDVTWIRLEVPATNPTGFRLLSAFLFELFDDQVNVVQATLRGRMQTLLFTRGDGPKPIA
ncbi:MAG: DUF6702 family protein [Gemmatimonadales bacterium]